MKLYFKSLMVALIATMTFTLSSCGDDDDDASINGGNSSSVVAFNLNGKDYYWAGDLYGAGEWYDPSSSWGTLSKETNANNEQYVSAIATAYSRKLKDADDLHYSNDYNTATLQFGFKNFNWETAKKGQTLEFDVVHRSSDDSWWGCEIGLMTPYSNVEQTYAWFGNNGVKGTAKFVSFKNDVVTIEFSNVVMTNEDLQRYGEVDNTNIPTTLTLNGTVAFVVEY